MKQNLQPFFCASRSYFRINLRKIKYPISKIRILYFLSSLKSTFQKLFQRKQAYLIHMIFYRNYLYTIQFETTYNASLDSPYVTNKHDPFKSSPSHAKYTFHPRWYIDPGW